MANNSTNLRETPYINPDVIELLRHNDLVAEQAVIYRSTPNLGDIYSLSFTEQTQVNTTQRIHIMNAVKEWSRQAPSDPSTEKTFSSLAIFDDTEL